MTANEISTPSGSEKPQTDEGEGKPKETSVATTYVPTSQYETWVEEASEREVSISTFISSMVERSLKDIQPMDEIVASEIAELRKRQAELKRERDEAQAALRDFEDQQFTVGLGRIKDFIIDNHGVNRREIFNFVIENTHLFVDDYLEDLESSEFVTQNENWYPPKKLGGRND